MLCDDESVAGNGSSIPDNGEEYGFFQVETGHSLFRQVLDGGMEFVDNNGCYFMEIDNSISEHRADILYWYKGTGSRRGAQ